jgi:hypothetical protein
MASGRAKGTTQLIVAQNDFKAAVVTNRGVLIKPGSDPSRSHLILDPKLREMAQGKHLNHPFQPPGRSVAEERLSHRGAGAQARDHVSGSSNKDRRRGTGESHSSHLQLHAPMHRDKACIVFGAQKVPVEEYVSGPVETLADVSERSRKFMEQLLFQLDYEIIYHSDYQRPPEPINVLVVTHQGLMQQLFKTVFKIPATPTFENGSLSRVDIKYTIEETVCKRVTAYIRNFSFTLRHANDTRHLKVDLASTQTSVTAGGGGGEGAAPSPRGPADVSPAAPPPAQEASA